MPGFLFILSVVLTVCCFTANMTQKWQMSSNRAYKALPTLQQQAAGSTACHREEVDKEPLFKVKKGTWKEMWYE